MVLDAQYSFGPAYRSLCGLTWLRWDYLESRFSLRDYSEGP